MDIPFYTNYKENEDINALFWEGESLRDVFSKRIHAESSDEAIIQRALDRSTGGSIPEAVQDIEEPVFEMLPIALPGEILAEIKKRPLLDLGAGDLSLIQRQAERLTPLGVKHYIAVERNHLSNKEEVRAMLENQSTDTIRLSMVETDMLSALKCLPDSSVNIYTGNIDQHVLGDQVYAEKIKEELSRVIPVGGCYIKICGDPLCDTLVGFEKVKLSPFDFKVESFTDAKGEYNSSLNNNFVEVYMRIPHTQV